jgi:hypothetical protein
MDKRSETAMAARRQYHYSFIQLWSWLENRHHPYTQFRAVPNARYVAEIWFDKIMKQAWRN